MANTYEGNLIGSGLKIGIVVSRYNEFITTKLLDGALDCLARHDVADDDIDVAWVPGSFEVPVVVKHMASSGTYDAVVALGCVLRGASSHFDFIAAQVSRGVAQAAHDTGVPAILGVITPDTIEQAVERAGTRLGNKGFEAARDAIEMANLMRAVSGDGDAA
ncbi:MAG: 6,7-dimethyl-8-ribityllumazine synthase [Armatimonadota bacterium]|jgi:6,7-dimethyl-8-ribityllumazine synthase